MAFLEPNFLFSLLSFIHLDRITLAVETWWKLFTKSLSVADIHFIGPLQTAEASYMIQTLKYIFLRTRTDDFIPSVTYIVSTF